MSFSYVPTNRFVQEKFHARRSFFRAAGLLALVFLLPGLGGCDRLSTQNKIQKLLQQGADRANARDARGAVAAWEQALDGTPKSAEAHFRLALLYQEQMQDAVGAMHHLHRYLELAPEGPHAKAARTNLSRAETTLGASLAGGTLLSRPEAAKLRTENARLRQQLSTANAKAFSVGAAMRQGGKSSASRAASAEVPNTDDVAGGAAPRAGPATKEVRAAQAALAEAEKKARVETRSYKVQPGDTLQGISRRFYRTPDRAKDILDANMNALSGDAGNLRAGMSLVIP